MSRLEIALMVAVLLVVGIAGKERPRGTLQLDCNRSDDPIACLLRAVDR